MAFAAWGGEKLTTEVLMKLSIDENATMLGLKTNEFINKEAIKKTAEVCCISDLPTTGSSSTANKNGTPGNGGLLRSPISTGRPH